MENEQMPVEQQAEVAPAEAVVETAPVAEVVAPKKGKVSTIVFFAIAMFSMLLATIGLAGTNYWFAEFADDTGNIIPFLMDNVVFVFGILAGFIAVIIGVSIKNAKVGKILKIVGAALMVACQLIRWIPRLIMFFEWGIQEDLGLVVIIYYYFSGFVAELVFLAALLVFMLQVILGKKPVFGTLAKLCMIFGIISAAWNVMGSFMMMPYMAIFIGLQGIFGAIAVKKLCALID